MNERTFNLAVAGFPYGGNGGMSNEYPGVRNFLLEVARKAKADPRIDEIHHRDFSDTPITMTRNQSVLWARQVGADFLLMVDSDMQPDCELLEDEDAKPFWDTSLDFCIQHFDKGPNVVCAPYCGPPPICNVYVFHWAVDDHSDPNTNWRIEQYTREEAARMAGIQPVAAQPTGLILFDMRAFELTDPEPHYNKLLKDGVPKEDARSVTRPWFYYEYNNVYQSEKGSTEDVTATRDISFAGHLAYERDVIYCNWDAWAGHVKPTVVRKPKVISADQIQAKYRHAVEQKKTSNRKMVFLGAGDEDSPHKERTPLITDSPQNGTPHIPEDAEEDIPNPYGIERIGMYTPECDLVALSALVAEHKPKIAIEIGSWVGESSIAIARSLPKGGRLFCVDHFQGSAHDRTSNFVAEHGRQAVKEAFLKNTKEYRESDLRDKGKIILWEMTDGIARGLSGGFERIDFLYLDADHEYRFVKRQIQDWLPLMAENGIIAGHDYNEYFPGVCRAVQESFKEFTHVPGTNVWWAYARDKRDDRSAEENGKPRREGHEQSESRQGEHIATGD